MAGQHPPSPKITTIAPGASVEVDRDDGHHVFAEVLSKRIRIWLVPDSFCRNVLKWSVLRKSFGDVRFFEEKVSVAPEPLAIWNKKLEGLDPLCCLRICVLK